MRYTRTYIRCSVCSAEVEIPDGFTKDAMPNGWNQVTVDDGYRKGCSYHFCETHAAEFEAWLTGDRKGGR